MKCAPAVGALAAAVALAGPAPGTCLWDLDGDGVAGVTEFLELLAAWGTDPGAPPDFDGGGVGITDLLELLAHWGPCTVVFDPLESLAGGPAEIAAGLWSPQARNLLCLGDSIMGSGGPARLYDAILRAWDLPAGWRGFHATTHDSNGVRSWTGFLDGYDHVDAFRRPRVVTEPTFGGPQFYGLPHRHLEHDVGLGFDNDAPQRRLERLELNPLKFSIGVVAEWFTGNPITAQVMYLYHGAPGAGEAYVAEVNVGLGAGEGELDGGPWRYAEDYSSAHGLSDIALEEPGINLLQRHHPIPTDRGPDAMRLTLRSTEAWELEQQLWCVHLGARVDGGPGGVTAGVLGEPTWQSWSWLPDAPAQEGLKQFTNAELDRYLEVMYPDKSSPLYVVVVEGPENTPIGQYIGNCHGRNDRLAAAWQRVGGESAYFVYVGIYRTADEQVSLRQNEAFFWTAQERTDTYYVNLYGLLGGILWDNSDTGGDQSAWAEAQGWDAIEINAGLLDMSRRNALDDSALHPADSEAAFFFAWVAADALQGAVRTAR